MPDLTLPADAVLLHVGPHKTGTTAVQSAFFAARDALAAHGIAYPGRGRMPMGAVMALTGYGPMTGEPPLDIHDWEALVASVPAHGRVVISSEFFADAEGEAVTRAVDDLGRDRVHVVVTLRPLDRIAPSQWQQYVQNGKPIKWRRWLRGILLDHVSTRSGFWRRHRHDALVRRWVDEVGPDRVTVIVVDESDKGSLLRTFERLVDAPEGILVPESDRHNRSLTWPEVELVRALNHEFSTRGWEPADYRRFVRLGVNRALKSVPPAPGAERVMLPGWAIERLRATSLEIVDAIRASGVRVVGDLDALVVAPPGPDAPESIPTTTTVPADVAARAVTGAIEAALAERSSVIAAAARRARRMSPSEIARRVRRRGRRA